MTNPQTLSAISAEPAGTAQPAASGAEPAPSTAPPLAVPRLPGTPDLTKEGLYSFAGGGLELRVDPQSGNVVRLTLDGKDALLPPDTTPVATPENYSAEVEGSSLLLQDAANATTKRFRLDTARRSIEISYTHANTTKGLLAVHLLDVLRVKAQGGLTFFPSAKLFSGATLKLNGSQPITWFAHDQAREPKALEAAFASVEGWVATVNDGLVLVKVISDEELRAHITVVAGYDQLAKQRPWVEIRAANHFELLPRSTGPFNVRLFLRKLPPNLAAKPGNQELVGFVRGIIQ